MTKLCESCRHCLLVVGLLVGLCIRQKTVSLTDGEAFQGMCKILQKWIFWLD